MSTPRIPFIVDDITKDAQRRAADPRASAWVSANAGAGKTKVLTDRVLRLLLDGTPPARILCLTFTKAAAANMSSRVFDRLGRWVTLNDAELTRELEELMGEMPRVGALRLARRLFARAVETPGGLKIETLHALCERLLQMFPFEANVPAQFAVLEERQAALAFDAAASAVLTEAFGGADVRLREALAIVEPEGARETLHDAIRLAMKRRGVLADVRALEGSLGALSGALGLASSETAETIARRILEDGPPRAPLAAKLQTGKANDEKLAAALLATDTASIPAEQLAAYRSVFFTDKDEPRSDKSLGTKSVAEVAKAALLDEQARLIPLYDALRSARAFARTHALFTLAAEIHRRIEASKASVGMLDFDDLIHKTLDLVRRVDASWVLYKLDRGIDHLLVDEAQDTNPDQWGILRALTAEFAAGKGAREIARTRFAVGDPKQSIYSFQGAEPREFERTRNTWKADGLAAGLRFEDRELTLSFRSTHAILRAVDAVFAIPEHFEGLSFEAKPVPPVHGSARGNAFGAVELWPIEAPQPQPEPDAWTAPVDSPGAHAPPILVARRIARAIRAWTTTGDTTGRIRRPGDILILVRKRSAAFEEVIRALKGQGVPVAGQDRLEVAAHIAVADLVAIGRAGLLPADDLTLAVALKTPLVGLDDDDLVHIAARRPENETLEDGLNRVAEAGDAAALRGAAALRHWIALAASEGPFGFYAALLGPDGGRAKLVARLGSEAADAIDVFLSEALKAESGIEAPSLESFLNPFIERADRGASPLTVKRDMEAGRDEVRVMTVHGAKGLEAPVVVLIDGCESVGGKDPLLVPMGGDAEGAPLCPPVWSSGKAQDSLTIASARGALKERGREEQNRLLYVAMTRAADHLVIAPYRGATPESPASWCEMIRVGLEQELGEGEKLDTDDGPVMLWKDGNAEAADLAGQPSAPIAPSGKPPWLDRSVAEEVEAAPPLNPSGAMSAADGRPALGRRQADADARRRGKLIHTLLEHLPRVALADRTQVAARFVEARAPLMPAAKRDAMVSAVLRLLDKSDLAPLFAPEARAEVALSGRVTVGGVERVVHGRVDRLAITEDAVLVCDFKTGRPPADDEQPPKLEAAQLAFYSRLLEQIYPGRRIIPMLVWTSGPVLRSLDERAISQALAGLTEGTMRAGTLTPPHG